MYQNLVELPTVTHGGQPLFPVQIEEEIGRGLGTEVRNEEKKEEVTGCGNVPKHTSIACRQWAYFVGRKMEHQKTNYHLSC